MKGIFWHRGNQQWCSKIGYRHKDDGTRTPTFFYFDGKPGDEPPADVIADVVNKKREWKKIKSRWPDIRRSLDDMAEAGDYSKPVWYDPKRYDWINLETGTAKDPDLAEQLHDSRSEDDKYVATTSAVDAVSAISKASRIGADLEVIINALRSEGILPKGITAAARQPTIREAITEYLDAQKKRTGLQIGAKIDVGTFNTIRNNLLLCLGFKFKDRQPSYATKIIDLDKPLLALDKKDVEAVAGYWHTLPGGVTSRRTVKNYLDGFKRFLVWAAEQDELGFQEPKAINKTLRMSSPASKVTEVDYSLLTNILNEAPERTKMYAFLALFCGFYQRDICELAVNEVEERDGDLFITGFRSKEDSEAKAEVKIKTTHWIPHALAEIMVRNKAPANSHGGSVENPQ